jgi:signal transduction histidine kinase
LAASLPESSLPLADELLLATPRAQGIALLDARGRPLRVAGGLPEEDFLAPLAGQKVTHPIAIGPGKRAGNVIIGFAPLATPGGRILRLDFPAPVLAAQQRALPILASFSLAVDIGLLALMILFLRHFLSPYETLLARARAAGESPGSGSQDEVSFLLSTFDKALEALAKRAENSAEADIAALERTLAPSLESGLLLLDDEGKLVAINALGASLLDIPESRTGTPAREALGEHPELLEIVLQSVASGRPNQRRECRLKVGGKKLTVGLSVHPLRRGDGSVRGWLALFADLTEVERRAREERLAESLARIGELAAGVAHELRNSLASLRGYLTLIERGKSTEAAHDYLGEIRHEADHLQRVLEDFLSFARPGTARIDRVDLERVVRRAAVDPALTGISVRFLRKPESMVLPAIRGDAQLLERAFRNLLHNAAQAQQGVGVTDEITVSFELSAEELRTIIADRGPGLDPQVRDRLFLPFASARPGGVGLGLALTHRILGLHGGSIRMEDRPGGGTNAVVSFPLDRFATERNESDGENPATLH